MLSRMISSRLLFHLLLLSLLSFAPSSFGQQVVIIDGRSYTFDFCRALTFGNLCWSIQQDMGTIQLCYQRANNGGGWLGVAFSGSDDPNGAMIGASAVIGWTGGPSGGYINNFDLTNYNENVPSTQSTLGLTQANVTTDSSSSTALLFTRLLTTPLNSGASIQLSGTNFVLEASGGTPQSPQSVPPHGGAGGQGVPGVDVGINSVSFTTGTVVVLSNNILQWRNAHASLMSIAFGFLFPVGIIFARFFKGYGPVWFHLHRTFVLTGVALVIAGFTIAVHVISTGQSASHRGIGYYVCSAMFFQVLTALVRPHPPAVGEKPSHWRVAWQALHHWNARIAYVFAIVNIYIGFTTILEPGTQYIVLFSVLWAFVMLVGIVLQLNVILRGSLRKDGVEGQQTVQAKVLDQPGSAPVSSAPPQSIELQVSGGKSE